MQQQLHSLFTTVIETVPSEDLCNTWAADRTIMLRKTSKRVKEAIDKIQPPTEVILNKFFWTDSCNRDCTVSNNEKLEFIMRQLILLATTCQITRIELPCCNIIVQLDILKDVIARTHTRTHIHTLTNLNLYNNSLGATGVASLIGVLVYGKCSVLNLAHNEIGTVGIESLTHSGVLMRCTNLNLCNNNIGTIGMEMIEMCKTLIRLTYLNLCYNQINTVNIDKILLQNIGLTHLDLSQNQINILSFDRIQIQTKYFALTDLNLSYNCIDDEGTTSLIGVLRQCTSLINLNLACNYIGTEGAYNLAEALGQCYIIALSKLYLASNLISDIGIERLTEVLLQRSSLTYLTLGGNGIGKDMAKNITEVLGHRVKLMF